VIEFGNILRAAGLTVVETPGWRTRGHAGTFAPVGGLWHHTGGNKDLPVVLNGRPDLAGPLAQLYHGRDGTFTVVCAGVAWHAGDGSQQVLDNLRKGIAPTGDAGALDLADDCTVGNHFLIGIESEGGLDGEDWPDEQIDSLAAGTAALCRELGISENHWAHHREWTRRKTDMSYRGDLRGRVHQLLNPPAASPPPVVDTKGLDVPVIIRAPGRPAAKLDPGTLKATPLGNAEWSAAAHLAAADPEACRIVVITAADHDTFTGKS
jgi:hypothetical protein